MLEGAYNPGSRTGNEYVAGLELAGVVEAVGPGVTAFTVGDRVLGPAPGAFADFTLLDQRHAMAVREARSSSR
ncbi:alcohol dehydrogenase catalytic domain-containing protein [Rhodococcus sp. T2V]|uniref:alcohol dehydrogenase catalytic domain-containing protein n=1 Tax=Rhodococcus sp. T2V TaxID=3034164 RepID=UPI0023E12C0F|nr:alcohol dehydrogenase catalytic domain-containing protein [Rhodococcus sp. T2V]MDF3313163.1 alcohol dehydrogenase catalytic domain-containing protein [Rhodococcus sp. T2V]